MSGPLTSSPRIEPPPLALPWPEVITIPAECATASNTQISALMPTIGQKLLRTSAQPRRRQLPMSSA